jgi:LacI family transcriptional regulator
VRERIQKEIESSGYITNQMAVNLVSQSSRLVGIAVMNDCPEKNIMGDPYFSLLFSYLQKEVKKKEKYILIIPDQSPERIVKDALRWNLDGLILCNYTKEKMVTISQEYMKPIVMIDAAFVHEYDKLVQIFIDDYDGGYQIGKYFISIGHKNVAMIDDNDEEDTRHRWRGFRQAYLDRGIKLDESSHIIININKEPLLEGFERFYPEYKDKSTIFCISDFVAIKLIKYLHRQGKSVPNDISIAGYDDILYSSLIESGLTTIRQNVELKARKAVESMMLMIDKKPVEHYIKLPVELVVRESCKPVVK